MSTHDSPVHIVVVGCLIRNGLGEILLIRHHKRGWEIPQGRVEAGEGIVDALRREVREETGVEIKPGPLTAVWSKVSPPASLILTFLADYAEGELAPSDETPELGWFSEREGVELVAHPVTRDRLRALLDYSGTVACFSYATNPYKLLGSLGEP
ncbi:NUDIX hydrolase [Geobacter metallireducens RCH3]|uniref:NUDIX hydrolase n=1 Tax=Geobacter metallireducens (strain ATCC 53774 / DSM 7210 / GS-15) TaxID=269799 RepID=Q39QF2_GEOMG|nr:NUDIX hydrolase [Geobacter metallireducens]ABB33522.1 NUDIX hydrolase [Geobacter metallireducens GS-15]EHP87629.1 NUDIX hydrolase [Geobacter metallireducens RCH3]